MPVFFVHFSSENTVRDVANNKESIKVVDDRRKQKKKRKKEKERQKTRQKTIYFQIYDVCSI